jgi:hypothetical protein
MALEHFCKGFAASLPAEKVASLLGNVENKVRPAAANGCDLCLSVCLEFRRYARSKTRLEENFDPLGPPELEILRIPKILCGALVF